MEKNGLTITVVIEAQSANYGESIGNIASLKQLSRGDGKTYTYISRQALRYSIVEQLKWNNTPVGAEGAGDKAVIQFLPDATITDYPEIDLFGYMKTSKGKKGGAATRNAVVRLSNAISLENYKDDTDFLNNKGLAVRIGANNNLAQSENHKSLYSYTLTIDLDRVGVERGNDNKVTEEIASAEKAKRVNALLDAVKLLYRDIRGRRENLIPIFAVGGVYGRKNPYFADKIKTDKKGLNIEMLLSAKEISDDAVENTKFGYLAGTFINDTEVKKAFSPLSIRDFFESIKNEVGAYYG
ncbi:MAG: type I-B CRISPR-associated protein Cas7/Cst2/DevR [Clostridiales bacterium]|jgi:CRISPR-associated protein Cst2|nr:type I-B CRISPR-associated protein Cas7/Cst2/DevR [Clostridiales bacterium]